MSNNSRGNFPPPNQLRTPIQSSFFTNANENKTFQLKSTTRGENECETDMYLQSSQFFTDILFIKLKGVGG